MSYSDPFLASAREGGVAQPVMVLAPTRDVVSPWIVYGEGCVLDAATLDADGLAMWQATGKVTAVITDLPTPPEPEAPTLSGVTATPDAADGTQCTITWTTDIDADSQVHYGADASYGSSSVLEPGMVTSHTVSLTGLTAATTYHFAAASGGISSADGTFDTITPEE